VCSCWSSCDLGGGIEYNVETVEWTFAVEGVVCGASWTASSALET
jgi:hypothetical protein